MGGRLDPTNAIPDDVVVVPAPTSVDLDYWGFFGNKVKEIPRGKAGILRRGKPFVLASVEYSLLRQSQTLFWYKRGASA